MDLSTVCGACGDVAAVVEVLAPGEPPTMAPFDNMYREHQDASQWRLVYGGIVGGNGSGDSISRSRAKAFRRVLTRPIQLGSLDDLGLYDDAAICRDCGVAYCWRHWSVSPGGYGRCPAGHGKSLDPHWSPDNWD